MFPSHSGRAAPPLLQDADPHQQAHQRDPVRTYPLPHAALAKQYEFSGEFSTKYASLILGLAEIEGDYFLVFVETVYVQTPFPPAHSGMYQIAGIGYLEFGTVVSNREREIFSTMKTVSGG